MLRVAAGRHVRPLFEALTMVVSADDGGLAMLHYFESAGTLRRSRRLGQFVIRFDNLTDGSERRASFNDAERAVAAIADHAERVPAFNAYEPHTGRLVATTEY